ncbi:MAG: Ig-like domain-containing protein, partial [Cohnella sp.]|nr:Ig-like domain-containing protein [Cohnella sp.]
DDVWTRVDGVLTLPEALTTDAEITGPLIGSTWYPIGFSKGIDILDDGTILNTMYGRGKAILVQSTDNGLHWTYRSTIAENDGTRYNTDGTYIYYFEPSLQRCSDGTLLSIIRTDGNKPLYQARSYDNGLTWTAPELLPGIDPGLARSVNPQTLILDNGVLVLTTGRPNNRLLFSLDGSGYKWDYELTTMVPVAPATTTGNTSISRIGVNKILQVGDNGWIHNAPAGIWGIVADINRVTVPNPAIKSASLKSTSNRMAIGTNQALFVEAVFDTNSNLIHKADTVITYYAETPEFAEIDSQTGEITAYAEGPATFTASVEHNGVTIMSNTVSLLIADAGKPSRLSTAVDRPVLERMQQSSVTNVVYNAMGDVLIDDITYSYSSSDETVAIVDTDGTITALSPGIATIAVAAHKGEISLTGTIDILVQLNNWQYDSFDQTAVLPSGFVAANSIGAISQNQANSGANSLYIRDDNTTAVANVKRTFDPAQAAIIEFMIYPELIDHSATISIGSGGDAIANEAFMFGFIASPNGSNMTKLQMYDGAAWKLNNPVSGAAMNTWSKVRVEAFVDKPAKIYVNDAFIGELPFNARLNSFDRIKFSSGGTAAINDFYYVDDVKVMYFGDISRLALHDIALIDIPESMQVNESVHAVVMASYSDKPIIAEVTERAEYSSSPMDVAVVSGSGTVTALKEGTATITAAYGGKEASVPLTVVAASKTLADVDAIADVYVALGTQREQINLPRYVGITLSDYSVLPAAISWNNGSPLYDTNAVGQYLFTGELELPPYVTNPGNLAAAVSVYVLPFCFCSCSP